ncbi:MAG: precorrin-6Y C5,15-methyltransferase (decarboxylating) subunit CbiT, partial [Clostridiales bacterium]
EPDPVAEFIQSSDYQRYAILVSGDVGFFSAAARLCQALKQYQLRLLPGISSVSAFAAKLGVSWQDAALISLHGSHEYPVETVRRHRRTFCLTGGNIDAIAHSLQEAGLTRLQITVGENLGYAEQKITAVTVAELAEGDWASLALLLIENPDYDDSIPIGIVDTAFLRGEAPMTKSEVRAISLAKLALKPDFICYDIGAGTGSVTVEMAFSAYRGRVYAIDKNSEALHLCRENCRQFHIGNVTLIDGQAPAALIDLPKPDAVFIGGSAGNMAEIINLVLAKNPQVRIVVNGITLETVHAAMKAMENAGIANMEIVQIAVAKAKKAGDLHLMIGQNPVTVISGGGFDE